MVWPYGVLALALLAISVVFALFPGDLGSPPADSKAERRRRIFGTAFWFLCAVATFSWFVVGSPDLVSLDPVMSLATVFALVVTIGAWGQIAVRKRAHRRRS